MSSTPFLAVVLLLCGMSICGGADPTSPAGLSEKADGGTAKNAIDIGDLPGPNKPFKVIPYARVAKHLQKIGKAKAVEQMTKFAQTHDDDRVTLLCRMLFVAKPGKEFRVPWLGAPLFFGDTTGTDWPLCPIELVDNIPFYVVGGYNIGGEAETSIKYLEYCLENCDWSTVPIGEVSEARVGRALQTLLASKKWKQPLTESEREFLSDQVK
ncbi:MAG: hypothetical protein SGJ20_07000 [Planctomycetota bacterium]|nr:hypothetical protein [Planctomycetota bacterium]